MSDPFEMLEQVRDYPLAWPSGRRRRSPAFRKDAPFGRRPGNHGSLRNLTFAEARARLLGELALLQPACAVLSTNVALDPDGRPLGPHEPEDAGAVLYVALDGRAFALPCDAYRRVAENVAALAAHLTAIRQAERLGVATVAEMLAGLAIDAAPSAVPWWRVLRVRRTATGAEIEAAYRRLALRRHPDRPGGSDALMADLNRAREQGLAACAAAR